MPMEIKEPLVKEEFQEDMFFLFTECKGMSPQFHLKFPKHNIQISD